MVLTRPGLLRVLFFAAQPYDYYFLAYRGAWLRLFRESDLRSGYCAPLRKRNRMAIIPLRIEVRDWAYALLVVDGALLLRKRNRMTIIPLRLEVRNGAYAPLVVEGALLRKRNRTTITPCVSKGVVTIFRE